MLGPVRAARPSPAEGMLTAWSGYPHIHLFRPRQGWIRPGDTHCSVPAGKRRKGEQGISSDVFQQRIKIAAIVLIWGSSSSGTRGTGSISRGGDSPRSLCLERCQCGAGHQRPGDAWPQAECPNGSQVGSGGINSGCPGFSFSYSEVL